jgi:rhamnogalacturonan endolyase
VGDIDDDGHDEIIYGSCVIDDDGRGLYSTGAGHGDAMHFTDIDPDRQGLEVFKANGDGPNSAGIQLRDARTGEQIFGVASKLSGGMGRAVALDVDPRHRGLEMWGYDTLDRPSWGGWWRDRRRDRNRIGERDRGQRDNDARNEVQRENREGPRSREENGSRDRVEPANGVRTGATGLYDAHGNLISNAMPGACNMGVWWDGDLLRELLDGVRVTKWDVETERNIELFDGEAFDCVSNNGSKSNPCLCADILGDWREEIIARTRDNRELRIFITTIPTERRMVTLMHDPIYRLAVAWQNVAYNQPAHPGFYLGHDMAEPARPDITVVPLVDRSEASE